ncbi:DNA polymerase III subunit delta [bacterium (Candidatus Torokbacteria) CG09_land_8_20_14_0_10_42_11]|nr:MAG: DNA polymerase III subunit delta [bacterium (Candidatus Torokbacteria) CG09_land_8_20_14_0_10_42_11]
MLLFLYGEDGFRCREKLNQIKEKFLEKDKQGLNLAVFKEEIVFSKVREVIFQAPFLGKSRLVILENVSAAPKDEREKIIVFLTKQKIPNYTVLVFYEASVPDRRGVFFKTLAKIAKAEEFTALSPFAVQKWIGKKVSQAGGKIQAQAQSELGLRLGNNLYALTNSLDQILACKGKQEIVLEDLRHFAPVKLEADIFKLVDALSRKERKAALKFIKDQIALGAESLYLLAMVTYAFRNLIIVKDLAERGMERNQIITASRLHPFVVQKTLSCASYFSLGELKKIYLKLMDLDIKIKTGSITPNFGLEMLIFGITV